MLTKRNEMNDYKKQKKITEEIVGVTLNVSIQNDIIFPDILSFPFKNEPSTENRSHSTTVSASSVKWL